MDISEKQNDGVLISEKGQQPGNDELQADAQWLQGKEQEQRRLLFKLGAYTISSEPCQDQKLKCMTTPRYLNPASDRSLVPVRLS